MCTKKEEKIVGAASQVFANPGVLVKRSASTENEDDFLYSNNSIVESLNRAREEMRQGKFIPKEDVIEDV